MKFVVKAPGCECLWEPGVVLAVVDPGVGTARRPVAVRAGRHWLVGPDNGLLWPAVEALGGATGSWVLARPLALAGAGAGLPGIEAQEPGN